MTNQMKTSQMKNSQPTEPQAPLPFPEIPGVRVLRLPGGLQKWKCRGEWRDMEMGEAPIRLIVEQGAVDLRDGACLQDVAEWLSTPGMRASTTSSAVLGGLMTDGETEVCWEHGAVTLRLRHTSPQEAVLSPEDAQKLAEALERRHELAVDPAALLECGATLVDQRVATDQLGSFLLSENEGGVGRTLFTVVCDEGDLVTETGALSQMYRIVKSGQAGEVQVGRTTASWNPEEGVLRLTDHGERLGAAYDRSHHQVFSGTVRAPAPHTAWLLKTLWRAARAGGLAGEF